MNPSYTTLLKGHILLRRKWGAEYPLAVIITKRAGQHRRHIKKISCPTYKSDRKRRLDSMTCIKATQVMNEVFSCSLEAESISSIDMKSINFILVMVILMVIKSGVCTEEEEQVSGPVQRPRPLKRVNHI